MGYEVIEFNASDTRSKNALKVLFEGKLGLVELWWFNMKIICS